MTSPLDNLFRLLKNMANDPSYLKRGIHRAGIVIGGVLALTAFVFSIICLCIDGFRDGVDLIAVLIFSILLAFGTPIILAKAVGWVVEGFQKRHDY